VISTVVLCPSSPLLFRELTGAQDPVATLREACRVTLASALMAPPRRVVVVGQGETTRAWDPATPVGIGRFGGPGVDTDVDTGVDPGGPGGEQRLPLPLGVGLRLLHEAGWPVGVELRSLAAEATREDVEALATELAGRDEAVVVLAVADGSARRAALRLVGAAARAQRERPAADVSYADDPFGVRYVVARWQLT
jgi:hypothetical protein